MKRFYNAILILVMVAAIPVIVGAQPKIVFDKMEHNFGTFKEADGIQTTTFEFTNKGTTPLILSSVNASCGCTTPEWTKQPIAPGAKGNIKVSYNPAHRPGAFNKTVSVQSNAENAMAILTIKGTVQEKEKTIAELYPREIEPLRTQNNHISYPTLKTSEVKTEKLELVNDTDKPVTVGIRTVPPHIKATVEPAVIAPKSRGSLTVIYDAKAANTYGFVSHRIYLTIDGSSDYKYSIGVSATIEEDFAALSAAELASAPVAAFNTMSYDFGDINQGEKKEYTFELSNKGKRDLMIRNVRSSCGCTAVSPAKNVIAPGETTPIKVVFDSTGKKGRQAKSVTVITNDPKNATINLRISTNIL